MEKSCNDGGFTLIVQESFVADVAPFISETDGSSMTNRLISTVLKYSLPWKFILLHLF